MDTSISDVSNDYGFQDGPSARNPCEQVAVDVKINYDVTSEVN